MASSVVDCARLEVINDCSLRRDAKYVLLWVQQDVRAQCNHALEFSIEIANALQVPVLACYGLFEQFPGATERAFTFLLDGLCHTANDLAARGVRLLCKRCPPPTIAIELGRTAACVIVDRGYSRLCREWREQVASELSEVRFVQVETNVVVPIKMASNTKEPAAATLRPKIQRLLPRFLVPLSEVPLRCKAANLELERSLEEGALNLQQPSALLALLKVDRSVPRALDFEGGFAKAVERLNNFLPRLSSYGNGKANDPSVQENSFLSPYLHFGHISSLDVALRIRAASCEGSCAKPDQKAAVTVAHSSKGATAYLEELIVRRELARNFCFYCKHYDSFDCLPDWARATLMQSMADRRPQLYTLAQLERGETDDPCWNAAQWEIVASGHMHNYMRMYWCKQLIIWTSDPRVAFKWAVHLNDKFSLDGRDENGYMGIAWCFGHHEKEFPSRPIFGSVRPMTRSGLESKFNMKRYCLLVQRKCQAAARIEPRLVQLLPPAALHGTTETGGALLRFLTPPKPATLQKATEDGFQGQADKEPTARRIESPAKDAKAPPAEDARGTKRPANEIKPAGAGLERFFKLRR